MGVLTQSDFWDHTGYQSRFNKKVSRDSCIMEVPPQLALLQAVASNSKGQHTARGRRRAMARVLDKLSSKYNKKEGGSLEDHEGTD